MKIIKVRPKTTIRIGNNKTKAGFGKPFYVKSTNKYYEWYKKNINFKIVYERVIK